MTVEQYAQKHGLNPETVRRYIRLGKIKAHRVGRRYEIDTYHNKDDTTHDKIQQFLLEKDKRIKQLTQHNEQLIKQNERLTQLLAMQTQQNHQLIAQLPPPRPTIAARITKLFTKISPNQT